jgi:hypothetical protein
MTITIKQFPGGRVSDPVGSSIGTPAGLPFVSRESTTTSTLALQWFPDRSQNSIQTDINDGAALSAAVNNFTDPALGFVKAQTAVYGEARYGIPGFDVVLEASADGRGVLTIEDSTDHVNWTRRFAMRMASGDTYGIRFSMPSGWYRVVYFDDGSHGANKVRVYSQFRP